MLDHFNCAMKHFFVSLFLVACVVVSTGAAAKTLPSSLTPSVRDVNESDTDTIFAIFENTPQFPGGEVALMSFISDNLVYPANAAENGIEGRVVVQFVVTKTGSIGQVEIVRSADPELDREAVRVVKLLPRFKPATILGEPVDVSLTLPINFGITNE